MQRYAFLASSPPPLYIISRVPLPRRPPKHLPPHDSIPSISSSKKGAVRQPLSRSKNQPVLVTRPTSTTSRGDQYCLLLVTSTGSIADQYWSQSPSSEASHNYLYIRAIPRSDLGTSLAQKRLKDSERTAIHILKTRAFQIQKGQISLYLSSLDLGRGRSISLPT